MNALLVNHATKPRERERERKKKRERVFFSPLHCYDEYGGSCEARVWRRKFIKLHEKRQLTDQPTTQ